MKILFVGDDAVSKQYQRMFEMDGHEIVLAQNQSIDAIVKKFRESPPTYNAVFILARGGFTLGASDEFGDVTAEEVAKGDLLLLKALREAHPTMPCIDAHCGEIGKNEKNELEKDPNTGVFALDGDTENKVTYMTDFLRSRLRENAAKQSPRRGA